MGQGGRPTNRPRRTPPARSRVAPPGRRAAPLTRAPGPQLFLGDTNRTISETPMNQASSRSHCVFTATVEARRPGAATVRRARLNLVDLAGSERVGKTGSEGNTLKEAK